MDQSPKTGAQPSLLGQPLAESIAQNAAAVTSPAPSLDEKVDEWVDAHPDDKSFKEPQATAAPPVDEPVEAPVESPPAEPPVPGTTDAPPSEPKAAAPPPESAAPQAVAPKPAEPAQPKPAEPTRFALDQQYVFAEGTEPWLGSQVVEALRERQDLLPKAQEADTYRDVFQMSAHDAKELWTQPLTWFRDNQRQAAMVASLMQDADKATYILNCADYYDTPEARAARGDQPQQQTLEMNPEVEKRFKQLEAQNKQLLDADNSRKKQQFTARISREINTAFERYPYLRDNPQMVQALLARAYWINGGDDSDNAKGVLDALEMERDLYDAKLAALNSATAIAHDAAAPPPPVPPLMGSGGASPQASQPSRAASARKFGTLDDAVDDWVNHPPAQFR